MKNETRVRSAAKSVWWRIFGVIILASITYFFTGSFKETTLITFIHHATFLLVFYLHERMWLKIPFPKKYLSRSLCKMFTYETLCGNIILGTIAYFVTGGREDTTVCITLTYIGIKHIMYIANEFIWKKIKWQKNKL